MQNAGMQECRMEDAMKQNLILDKSFAFSVRMVRAYQHISETKREYVLSKQLLRAATSIGANVHEANNAQGKKDFIAKMYIAYKEASETEYWIKLLTETDYFTDAEGKSLLADCVELKQILTAILRSAKSTV
jgi:four helix bundle protein